MMSGHCRIQIILRWWCICCVCVAFATAAFVPPLMGQKNGQRPSYPIIATNPSPSRRDMMLLSAAVSPTNNERSSKTTVLSSTPHPKTITSIKFSGEITNQTAVVEQIQSIPLGQLTKDEKRDILILIGSSVFIVLIRVPRILGTIALSSH